MFSNNIVLDAGWKKLGKKALIVTALIAAGLAGGWKANRHIEEENVLAKARQKAVEFQNAGIDHPSYWARAVARGQYNLTPNEIRELNRVSALLGKHPHRLLIAAEDRADIMSVFRREQAKEVFPTEDSRANFLGIHRKIQKTPGSYERVAHDEALQPFLTQAYNVPSIRERRRRPLPVRRGTRRR